MAARTIFSVGGDSGGGGGGGGGGDGGGPIPDPTPFQIGATISVDGTSYSIDASSGVQWNLSLGMSANSNTLTLIAAGGAPPTVGGIATMTLQDGNGGSVVMENLTVHGVQTINDISWSVTLTDRRWLFRFGEATGRFNIPRRGVELDANDVVVAGTLDQVEQPKDLKAMIELLFDRVGIDTSMRDTSLLPTDVYPPVEWEFVNPAQEIDRLLADNGYAVSLWPDSLGGGFKVVRLGQWWSTQVGGVSTPDGVSQLRGDASETGLAPSTVVVGGRIVVQFHADHASLDNPFKPAGLDLDGTIKRLDLLSYFLPGAGPYGGFSNIASTEPSSFTNAGTAPNVVVPPGKQLEDVQKAAAESVWRYYINDWIGKFYLPWSPEIADTILRDGKPVRSPTQVYVRRYDPKAEANETTISRLEGGFSVDLENGVIKFSELTNLYVGSTGRVTSAEIDADYAFLSIGIGANNNHELTEDDYYVYPNAPIPPNANILRRPSLVLFQRNKISESFGGLVELNRAELDAFSASLIAQHRWTQSDPAVVGGTANGVIPAACDGIIRQITWSVRAGSGAETVFSVNREYDRSGEMNFHEKLRHQEMLQRRREHDEARLKADEERANRVRQLINRSAGRDWTESAALGPGAISQNQAVSDFSPGHFTAIVGSDDYRPNVITTKLHGIPSSVPTDLRMRQFGTVFKTPVGLTPSIGRVAVGGVTRVRIAANTGIQPGDFVGPGDVARGEQVREAYRNRGPFVVIGLDPDGLHAIVNLSPTLPFIGQVTACASRQIVGPPGYFVKFVTVSVLDSVPRGESAKVVEDVYAGPNASVVVGMTVMVFPISPVHDELDNLIVFACSELILPLDPAYQTEPGPGVIAPCADPIVETGSPC